MSSFSQLCTYIITLIYLSYYNLYCITIQNALQNNSAFAFDSNAFAFAFDSNAAHLHLHLHLIQMLCICICICI